MIEKNHLFVGAVIIALVFSAFYMMGESSESNLTVSIDGMDVEEDTYTLQVFGSLRDAEYVSSKNAYVVLQGQTVTIEAGVYNPASSANAKWYRTCIHTDGQNIVCSAAVYLEPDEIKESILSYKVPYNTGRYSICVESEVKDPFSDVAYRFDDIDCFTVEVVSPNPCIGITCNDYCSGTTLYNNGLCVDGVCEYDIRIKSVQCGYMEPTPTPTSTPTPTPTATTDPCYGVTCYEYCEGTTYYYNGFCDGGQCVYQIESNSAQCPTDTQTGTPTATPTTTPSNGEDGDMGGILWWGGGIIAVLLILMVTIRSKK